MKDICELLDSLGLNDGERFNSSEFKSLPKFESSDAKVEIKDDLVIKYNPSFYDGLRESIMYRSLDHPNIIKCRDIEVFDFIPESVNNPRTIDIQKMVKITFDKYIPCDDIAFSQNLIKNSHMAMKMFIEIVDAMYYLSLSEILHSDIKPANIFFDKVNDRFLLADFDLVTVGKEYYSFRVFTPATAPPEIKNLVHGVNDFQGDVFSLAITLTTLLKGDYWYSEIRFEDKNNQVLTESIDKNLYNELISNLKSYIDYFPEIEMIMKMLSYECEDRPSIEEIYNYFVDKNMIIKKEMKSLSLIKSEENFIRKLIYDDYIFTCNQTDYDCVNNTDYLNLVNKSSFLTNLILEMIGENMEKLNSRYKIFIFILIELSALILTRALTAPQADYSYKKSLPRLIDYSKRDIAENILIGKLCPSEEKLLTVEDIEELLEENCNNSHEMLILAIVKKFDFKILV